MSGYWFRWDASQGLLSTGMNNPEVKAGQEMIPISCLSLPVSSMLWPESKITIN
jgi:hypothetical protein